MIRRRDAWPLGVLGFLFLVTAAWWALALWPLPAEAPAWLERTRSVCFNTTPSGLPDASGWILLIGQPLGMLAVLQAGWGSQVRDTLRHLAGSRPGRTFLASVASLAAVGVLAAGIRVARAGGTELTLAATSTSPDGMPRLDRPWPAAGGLVDQSGRPFSLARLGGRPAFVTFAYAHCETVCPLLVQSSLAARDELATASDLAVVALTLDPWRDTPARLPGIARRWSLAPTDFALSGSVEAVEAALDAWGVSRTRNRTTGDLIHPALVYLVRGDGVVVYESTGAPEQLVALGRRLLSERDGDAIPSRARTSR